MMHTRFISLSPSNPDSHDISTAAAVLRSGGLVAFPTETVYGLGADAFNVDAVKKVFEAKGRPAGNPLIVHISRTEQLEDLAEAIPAKARTLSQSYWPGPLTLVLKASGSMPRAVTANLETVAVRIPNHPVALALINALGRGVVAPSANISGRPSPTTGRHVEQDLHGKIDMILDAGKTVIGLESTVIDVTVDPPVILRQGGLTKESIEATIGPVATTDDQVLLRRSPGTRYRHYAPTAKVILVGEGDKTGFSQLVQTLQNHSKVFGSITHSPNLKGDSHHIVLESDADLFARELFGAMRKLDEAGVEVIVIECVREQGIGVAVMERLRKAAAEA